jgi:putative transposase
MLQRTGEDLEGWRAFLCHRKDRGLKGVRLIISDACRGLLEAAAEVFPKTDWQRCVVHFYRNVFSHVPNGKVAEVARMLKAIHAQEDRRAAKSKTKEKEIVARLKELKLRTAAELVEQKVEETMTYYAYPSTQWRQIRTNKSLERIIREIRRRTRVVGAFPDGHSALMLAAERLRHIASTKWGKRRNMLMDLQLNPAKQEAAA